MTSSTLSAPPTSNISLRWLAPVLRVVGAIFAVLPFLPPILRLSGKDILGDRIDGWLVGFCHRLPERSLSIGAEIMPLCSRCLGISIGAGLGLLIGKPFYGLRILRIWISMAAAFLFLELTTQDLGWHPVFHPTRLLSGFLVAYPLGAAATALATTLRQSASYKSTLFYEGGISGNSWACYGYSVGQPFVIHPNSRDALSPAR